ncbi:MAG: hypothetical protein R3B72_40270 [Polyangiaceae bacterium]
MAMVMVHHTTSLRALSLSLLVALAGCTAPGPIDPDPSDDRTEPADPSDLPGDDDPTQPADPAVDVQGITMSVKAGASGKIWVLDTYGNGNNHPGAASIDIGASGGSSVWHQVGDLPDEVVGGWIFVDHVKESGLCSQYSPGDDYYNGAKLRVYTLFYDANATFLGSTSAVYQHVEPSSGISDAWRTWNRAGAGMVLWTAPDATLGAGGGGLQVGTLFSGGGETINNGPTGKLCHSGDHLHQESAGWRNAGLALQDDVTAKESDLHFFTVSATKPFAPPAEPSPATPAGDPPSDPPTEPPPSDPPSDPPTQPAYPSCSCEPQLDNFCGHAPNTAGCPMTQPGGYCDPNGDGSYSDGDWTLGWYEYAAACN